MEIKMVLGPPGTGKTTTLLNILEEELMHVEPERIAYVSYTRKGAYEGRDRARDRMNLTINQLPFFRTLHSIAYRDLGITRGGMLEDNKNLIKQFSKKMGMNFLGYYSEDFYSNDDQYLFFDFLHRNNPKTASEYLMGMNEDILKWVRNNYKRFKDTIGLPDYTDIIESFVKKGESLPVDVAIIDEAQDLTTLQWQMIWVAFSGCKRIYIAGDDDQAIYEWSGADVDYFISIKAEIEILKKSYRLPEVIHEYSAKITDRIQKRIPKEYYNNGMKGELHKIMDFKEVDIDNGESWLFLSRNRWYLKDIEAWLKDLGKVYYNKENFSVTPSVISAINKHSFILKNPDIPRDQQSVSMINFLCNSPAQFEKPWYEEFTKMLPETRNYYRRIIGSKTDTKESKIKLSTIHGIKGGEADNVVMVLDINRAVSKNMNIHHDAEMRCYYVGITRAKKRLFLVKPHTKYCYPMI